MKAKKQSPIKQRIAKPQMPWQTGEYSRLAEFHSILPYAFLLLCKLWAITPENLLSDFMDNVAHGSWKREGRKAAKSLLVQYILAMGYGQRQYTARDIENMFTELDALGLLFPHDNAKVMGLYVQWREEHYQYWFNKWQHKHKKNDAGNTTL